MFTFSVLWQEVVGSLVTHIGSGTPADIDHALATLTVLAEVYGHDMQRFAILIKVAASAISG